MQEDIMGSKPNRKSKSVPLIILAVLLLACNLSRLRSGSSTSSSNNNNRGLAAKTSDSQSGAFDPSSDARQNLRNAYIKLKTTYPYRLTETTTFSSGNQATTPPTVRVSEFAAADRIHTTLNGDELGITFGDKHYMYANGKWVETGQQPKRTAADMEKLVASSLKDVQPVGQETANGVPCFTYTTRFEFNVSNQPSTTIGKVWIGLADGLPHQWDGDWKVANYDTKSHLVYEYNVDIKVEKPGP
jgi:hypothetical protein